MYNMEWNGMVFLKSNMEWRFFSYAFDVKVTNAVSWDESGHSHHNICIL